MTVVTTQGLRCVRVGVRCVKSRPSVYPWRTLPTHGTFRPFLLRHIGFWSHPLSHSELLIRFSETSLMTSLLILTHNSWRNPYLDSIMRLIPIVKVPVHQECLFRPVPRRLSPRRVESLSSPLAELGQPVRHREVYPSLLEPPPGRPTKIHRMYPSPEASFLCRIPLPNFRLSKSNEKRSE